MSEPSKYIINPFLLLKCLLTLRKAIDYLIKHDKIAFKSNDFFIIDDQIAVISIKSFQLNHIYINFAWPAHSALTLVKMIGYY